METIKMLKREGGDYSVEDYDGRTPLHIAAAEGHNIVVEAMLGEGAPVHCRDRYGHTPLHDAITNKNFHTIELLVNAGAKLKQTEYHIANELCTLALMNDLDGITAWHVGGANLDSKNYDGRTALHIAVAERNEDIVRYLVSQGCDPKMEDRLGRTPFSEIGESETDKTANLVELLEWGESLKPSS